MDLRPRGHNWPPPQIPNGGTEELKGHQVVTRLALGLLVSLEIPNSRTAVPALEGSDPLRDEASLASALGTSFQSAI